MLLSINESDPRPLYLQLVLQIKEQVAAGTLKPGEALPGVRELADALGINLHTVHRAYRELRDAGVIVLRLGRRARIAPAPKTRPARHDIEACLVGRLNELITEAFCLRMAPEEFRALVDKLLSQRPGGPP